MATIGSSRVARLVEANQKMGNSTFDPSDLEWNWAPAARSLFCDDLADEARRCQIDSIIHGARISLGILFIILFYFFLNFSIELIRLFNPNFQLPNFLPAILGTDCLADGTRLDFNSEFKMGDKLETLNESTKQTATLGKAQKKRNRERKKTAVKK